MTMRRSLLLALFSLLAALAPAPQLPPPPPGPQIGPPLPGTPAEIRVRAGVKAFEMAWLYYSENRIDADKVYRWSRRLLEAQRDVGPDKTGQIAACEAHVERMKKLQAKIQRIRKIGFGDSLDVLEADFYAKEADCWLFEARNAK